MNVRQTLIARARETGASYKQLLTHYAMERFLYRLSCSPHAGSFFLKGGMLLMGMGISRKSMPSSHGGENARRGAGVGANPPRARRGSVDVNAEGNTPHAPAWG